MPRKTTLEGYLRRLNDESNKRLGSYERTLKKAYTSLLGDMNKVISNTYAKLDDNDLIGSLQKYHRKDNVEKNLTNLINEFSKAKYKGMYNGLKDQITYAYDYYHTALTEVTGKTFTQTPLKKEWLTQTIENELSGLTLKQTIQRDRQSIIYSLKSNLIQGVNRGESYSQMAKRMKDVVNGDYQKAVRIARTETHRVKEAGTYESALKGEKAGIKQVKTWNSSNDGRTRKEHRRLDGETIPLDEYFRLGSAKTLKPGDTGRAEHDINCRCFLTYEIVDDIEVKTPTDKNTSSMTYNKVKTRQQAEKFVESNFGFSANYEGLRVETANAINQTLVDSKNLFGDKLLVDFIGVADKDYQNLIPDAFLGIYENDTRSIMYIPQTMKQWEASSKKAYKVWHHSTPSPYHTFRHEMGHGVGRYYVENKPSIIEKIEKIRKDALKDIPSWGISTEEENRRMGEMLSSYAFTNTSEFIAESVAEYMNGNPRSLAKKVVNILLKG